MPETEKNSLAQPGFFAELRTYLRRSMKWWLGTSVVLLVLLAILVILAGKAMPPFIYTLF
jgi:hypothetical protein